MPDQGGDSEKVLSFSIDYLQVEIEDQGCIGGGNKMKNVKIFEKFNFHPIFSKFKATLPKNRQNINKKLIQ